MARKSGKSRRKSKASFGESSLKFGKGNVDFSERFSKLFSILFRTLFIVFPIFVVLLCFNLVVFNLHYYDGVLPKYSAVENASGVNLHVLEFLQHRSDSLGLDVVNSTISESIREGEGFEPREISHMHDVRGLMDGFQIVMYFLFILVIVLVVFLYRLSRKKMNYSQFVLRWCGLGTMGLTLAFGLLGIFFRFGFEIFHKIFFNGNSYMFPLDSLLIRLYPIEFFRATFLEILGISFGIGFVLFMAGLFLKKMFK